MANYFRVGNRTFTGSELGLLSKADIEKVKADGVAANEKRLENMRKGLGMEPQKVTLDVTPAAVAARKAAIEAEEAKIAAETKASSDAVAAEEARIADETKAIEEDLGPEAPSFVEEAEVPAEVVETKKSKGGKKAS